MKTVNSYARITLCFVAMLLGVAGFVGEGVAVENKSSLTPSTQVTTTSAPDMTLGDCEDVQTPDNPDGPLGGELSPAAALRSYWYHKFNEVLSVNDAKVTVLQAPKHGALRNNIPDKTFGTSFYYTPDHGFLGQDKITFLVEVGGKSVKVVTTLIVVEVADLHDSPCFKGVKRISSTDTPVIKGAKLD